MMEGVIAVPVGYRTHAAGLPELLSRYLMRGSEVALHAYVQVVGGLKRLAPCSQGVLRSGDVAE